MQTLLFNEFILGKQINVQLEIEPCAIHIRVARLTVDPGFASSKFGHITFVEITHEINLHLLIQK